MKERFLPEICIKTTKRRTIYLLFAVDIIIKRVLNNVKYREEHSPNREGKMTVENARAIVCRIARLAELAASFTAIYGKTYRLTEDSPQAAWDLYREVMAEQAEIAGLLELDALQNSYSRYGEWWKRADVMDTAIVNELASEAFNLIGRCAYLAVNDETRWSNSDLVLQRSIAGILHPATRQTALENHHPARKAI
jgi:hypothetical protein